MHQLPNAHYTLFTRRCIACGDITGAIAGGMTGGINNGITNGMTNGIADGITWTRR